MLFSLMLVTTFLTLTLHKFVSFKGLRIYESHIFELRIKK